MWSITLQAIADLDEALNKPIDTVKVNILGNVQVLEACRVAEIKRYVYASTVYVYSRDGVSIVAANRQQSIM